MNKNSLLNGLNTKILGKELIYFPRTDSTNLQAKLHTEKYGIEKGLTFVAQEQSHGKGTDGNIWESGSDNLSLSIVFNYDDKINTLFPLYPAVALAKILNNNYQIKAHVKWPNDILVGNKKIAGILCEGVSKHYMIVGIGLNVNTCHFSAQLRPIATSMKQVKGHHFIIEEVFRAFLEEYENLLYSKTCNIRKEWLARTQMIGKKIEITLNGKSTFVTVCGMSQEGFLQIKNKQGEIEHRTARRGLDISMDY